MNIKKTFILTVSALLVASSAFAWSKKTEGQANIGRAYLSIEGGAQFNDYKAGGETKSRVGGEAAAVFNIPVFKPNVNVLSDISWIGMDAQIIGNFSGGKAGMAGAEENFKNYGVGAALVPYLNFETGWEYFQAVKPFIFGKAGYAWTNNYGTSATGTEGYFAYSFGAGCEFVITENLSVTGTYTYNENRGSDLDIPTTSAVGVEVTYWTNGILGFSLYASHCFNEDYDSFDVKGTSFGVKFKIGFNR